MRNVTTTSTPVSIGEAPTVPDLAELGDISRRFETRPASALVAWAYHRTSIQPGERNPKLP